MTDWVCLVGVRSLQLLANKILVEGAQPNLELMLHILHAVALGMGCNASPIKHRRFSIQVPVLRPPGHYLPPTDNFLPVNPNCIARNSP